ncbi:MAG TPA: TetR/AcrR family transcriptional regulator [Acidobacteriaceae bacterium]|nr:TetR/AcrR family transcriptional regulator [Acidobacteriaceae bacterium]
MTARRNATTARILATAADLFAGNAYADVSVDQIAQQAGITKMTLYQHFSSKNELALECLRMRLNKREERLDKLLAELDPKTDPLLAIFDWLQQGLDPKHFKGCSFVKAVNELSIVLPEVREIALDAKQKIRQRLTTLARRTGRKNPGKLGQELALLFEGAQSLAQIECSARSALVAKRVAARLLQT